MSNRNGAGLLDRSGMYTSGHSWVSIEDEHTTFFNGIGRPTSSRKKLPWMVDHILPVLKSCDQILVGVEVLRKFRGDLCPLNSSKVREHC